MPFVMQIRAPKTNSDANADAIDAINSATDCNTARFAGLPKKPDLVRRDSQTKTSAFHGVTHGEKNGIYLAQVGKSGKNCYAGRYDLETDAAYMHMI